MSGHFPARGLKILPIEGAFLCPHDTNFSLAMAISGTFLEVESQDFSAHDVTLGNPPDPRYHGWEC